MQKAKLNTITEQVEKWHDEGKPVSTNDPEQIEKNIGLSTKRHWLKKVLDLIKGGAE